MKNRPFGMKDRLNSEEGSESDLAQSDMKPHIH